MNQILANSSLDTALTEMREQYVARNPASLAAHVEAAAAMPGGNTRSVLFHAPFPLTMVRGEACRLWDADGHEYVDMLGEYTAGLYGHSNPIIRDAIDTALDAGWNMGGHGKMEARLARTICERFPSLDLVRLHQFRHRGQPHGHRHRCCHDRPKARAGVRRRLSWRHSLFRRWRHPDQRAASMGVGAL